MNTLFKTSNNEAIVATNRFESSSNYAPIPADTELTAFIDQACWDEFADEERYVSLRWSVLTEEYAGRKIFQKIRVFNGDVKKADRQKMMFATIDGICGGELAKLTELPTDMDLMTNLVNKTLMIKVDVWEIEGKEGNWIKAVSAMDVEEVKSVAIDYANTNAAVINNMPDSSGIEF